MRADGDGRAQGACKPHPDTVLGTHHKLDSVHPSDVTVYSSVLVSALVVPGRRVKPRQHS